ncbi:MAG: hypothetical protein M5R40_08990 [Anaerolineae bacterium]|nr:hypothetical protein [Anaerolineae bacterium]
MALPRSPTVLSAPIACPCPPAGAESPASAVESVESAPVAAAVSITATKNPTPSARASHASAAAPNASATPESQRRSPRRSESRPASGEAAVLSMSRRAERPPVRVVSGIHHAKREHRAEALFEQQGKDRGKDAGVDQPLHPVHCACGREAAHAEPVGPLCPARSRKRRRLRHGDAGARVVEVARLWQQRKPYEGGDQRDPGADQQPAPVA